MLGILADLTTAWIDSRIKKKEQSSVEWEKKLSIIMDVGVAQNCSPTKSDN